MIESDGWMNVSGLTQKSKKQTQKEKQDALYKDICDRTKIYLVSLTNDREGAECIYALIHLIQNTMNLVVENGLSDKSIKKSAVKNSVVENLAMLEKWNNPKYTKEQVCNLSKVDLGALIELEGLRKKLWGVRLYQRNNEFLINEKRGFDFEFFSTRLGGAVENLNKCIGITIYGQNLSEQERKLRKDLMKMCDTRDIIYYNYDETMFINIIVYKRTINFCNEILRLQDLLKIYDGVQEVEEVQENQGVQAAEQVEKVLEKQDPKLEAISEGNKGERAFQHWLQQKREREMQEEQLAHILKRHEEERRILAFKHAQELLPFKLLIDQEGEPEYNVNLS